MTLGVNTTFVCLCVSVTCARVKLGMLEAHVAPPMLTRDRRTGRHH